MPILHLPGEIIPGQLGPIRRVSLSDEEACHAHHVQGGNSFGNRDHERKPGVRRFHDGVGGERWRNEDDAGICSGAIHGFLHGVEYRDALNAGPAFARRDARHNFGAISHSLLRVEHTFAARYALHNQARILIN